jgi:hypothetical protein
MNAIELRLRTTLSLVLTICCFGYFLISYPQDAASPTVPVLALDGVVLAAGVLFAVDLMRCAKLWAERRKVRRQQPFLPN